MDEGLLVIPEIAGTLAFAISGIRLASAKQFDWFGAYVVGLVTAIGGGTVRDMMLGLTPFWMLNAIYLEVTAAALLIVIIFGRYLIRLNTTFFAFDTIGLALFVVVGIQKTLAAGFPFWVAIVMGTITGVFGSIIRDILINELPLVFRKDIYALACVFGGLFYWLFWILGFDEVVVQYITAGVVMLTRYVSVRYHLGLPVLKGEEMPDDEPFRKRNHRS